MVTRHDSEQLQRCKVICGSQIPRLIPRTNSIAAEQDEREEVSIGTRKAVATELGSRGQNGRGGTDRTGALDVES